MWSLPGELSTKGGYILQDTIAKKAVPLASSSRRGALFVN